MNELPDREFVKCVDIELDSPGIEDSVLSIPREILFRLSDFGRYRIAGTDNSIATNAYFLMSNPSSIHVKEWVDVLFKNTSGQVAPITSPGDCYAAFAMQSVVHLQNKQPSVVADSLTQYGTSLAALSGSQKASLLLGDVLLSSGYNVSFNSISDSTAIAASLYGDQCILIPSDNMFTEGNVNNAVSGNKVEVVVFGSTSEMDYGSPPLVSPQSLGHYEALMSLQLGLVGIDPVLGSYLA